MARSRKETINVLMNIMNYFGEHTGRLGPILIFLGVSAAPFILYIFWLSRLIPIGWALAFEVLFTIRMALLILGKENQKCADFVQLLNNVYATADDLIDISQIHEDGLVEYVNGDIVYVVSAFCMSYDDDDALSIDLQEFVDKLQDFTFDVYCHQVNDEFRLQDNMDRMKVYTDNDLMKERMDFYIKQDEYCHLNGVLYRINFVVSGNRYEWEELRNCLEELVTSDAARVFKYVTLCDRDAAEDVISRDVCMNIQLRQMLIKKYKNEDYAGSKVLYYNEEIPQELKPAKEGVGLNRRRIAYKEATNNDVKR